jgi:hypothetical protein
MKVHIREGDLRWLELRTRLPFKYGIATMTSCPHVFVRLRVEVDGRLVTGIAADHLPPKWFTKDPARPIDDEIKEMLRVIQHARRAAIGLRGDSAFDVWRELYLIQDHWGDEQTLPPLLVHFGTSLVERALIEAVCRATGKPFAIALLDDTLGMRLGEIHPELKLHTTADYLPDTPLEHIMVRHTVGLLDPLEDDDIAPEERLDDGLPQSLAACFRTYGIVRLKIKVSGDAPRDIERLTRLARVVQAHGPHNRVTFFSLDGNEQFRSFAAFQQFFEEVKHCTDLSHLFRGLLFIEQPLHRGLALESQVGAELTSWSRLVPIIIDESDGQLDSLPRALELGYSGTSHKNCKGVFKGVANRCLLFKRKLARGLQTVMSGEDLANIGPIALLQDLAVCATLGLWNVERNGHHYFAGLSGFPPAVQQQILDAHPDLYGPSRDGWPSLNITDGKVSVASLNAAPLGVGPVIDVDQFPLAPDGDGP